MNINRYELTRMLVLNEITDDYENLEHINERVADLGSKLGLAIRSSEVMQALSDLIETGLAKAYRLYTTGQSPSEIRGIPELNEIDDCYFFATEKGSLELSLLDDDCWPFDDEGSVRANWSLAKG